MTYKSELSGSYSPLCVSEGKVYENLLPKGASKKFVVNCDNTPKALLKQGKFRANSCRALTFDENLYQLGRPGSTVRGGAWALDSVSQSGNLPSEAGWEYYLPALFDRSRLAYIAGDRFRSKVRSDTVELMMLFGTMRQSLDMITQRLNQVKDLLGGVIRRLRKDKPYLKRVRKRYRRITWAEAHGKKPRIAANTLLEVKFGWVPLIEDLSKADNAIAGASNVLGSTWIRASVMGFGQHSMGGVTTSGTCRVSYSALVTVTNPNAFLAESMGLINPLKTIVDIVPWSWVVGMFYNQNGFLNSLSFDFGASLAEGNLTTRTDVVQTQEASGKWGYVASGRRGWAKRRELLPPPVGLYLKMPKLDAGLAITASALVLQRFKKIQSLLGRGIIYTE